MTEPNTTQRRRWRADIDLAAGRTRVRPIDERGRPDPASSNLLDAMKRTPRTEPSHHDTAPPLNPWQHQGGGVGAQPQDSDCRAGLDVRVPASISPSDEQESAVAITPTALEHAVTTICSRVTEGVLVRVRDMLGFPPEEPGAPAASQEQPYILLNPAGAFVTAPPETEYNVAGAFVDPAEPSMSWPTTGEEASNPAGSFIPEQD
jgi:hypothetical protein